MAERQELEEHMHQSVIHGHHIYQNIWRPYTGKRITLQDKDSNTQDRHVMCLLKDR